MNKLTHYLIPVLVFSFLLMACGLSADVTPTTVPVSPPPATVTPKIPRFTRTTPSAGPASTPAAAGAAAVAPCSLVTTAEAEAILGEPATAPKTVSGGCAFNNAKNSLYAVSIAAAQDQQANALLQEQAMLLGFAGIQLDQTRLTKLKTLATALDFKGSFAELVAAAQGAATIQAQLIDGGGNDAAYWAWLTGGSRRQGAFVAARGPTLVNINVVVADTQTEQSMLAACQALADKIFARLPAKFTLAAPSTTTPSTASTPEAVASAGNGTYVTIKVPEGTTTRTADLYLPAKYANGSDNVPLILSFHGFGGSGAGHGTLTGLDTLADTYGLLVAYPDGLPIDPNNLTKGLKWDDDPGSPDVKFISDLITKIKNLNYRVDPKRIFATGMSNGGGMTNRVGCDLADLFAAVAPVEGGYTEPGWKDCSPVRSMPIMAFHGLTDPVVPYKGGAGTGPAKGVTFPSILDWAAAWAKRDACNATPTVTTPTRNQSSAISVTRQEWTQCKDGASVILFSINPHGHTWPKGEPIDAATEIWKFFQAHSLP